MMTGTVLQRRAIVPLLIRGPHGRQAQIETILDTGFSGFLTLPVSAVAALALTFLNYFRAALADGSVVRLEVYAATVIWDGVERDVEVLSTGRSPLLGTSLLNGHEVRIQFKDTGSVTIARV
jgi:clan AA aspartic protease